MGRKLFIGVDLGTSSLKTVLYSLDKTILSSAQRNYQNEHPRPAWAQQDPKSWWRAAKETIKEVVAAKKDGDEIIALSCSSQAPTMLPLDEEGEILYPAVIWFDKRSQAEMEYLLENVGNEKTLEISGNRINSYFAGVKMRWFKEKHPELYKRTYKFLQASGFINYKLTGKFSVDTCHLSLIGLGDVKTMGWSKELINAFGLDKDKLPAVTHCGQVTGEILPEVAKELGLEPGVLVLGGGVDTPAALLGDGIYKTGQAYLSIGTGASMGICTDQIVRDSRLQTLTHMVPGIWLLLGVMTAVGGSLNWFKEQLGGSEIAASELTGINAFDLLNAQAEKSKPGANNLIFLPYMMGEQAPIWDNNARGVFFGLSLSTSKADMVRAIMEGCAFGVRQNLDIAKKFGPINSLRVSGGPNKSRVWNQIWADVTGIPVEIPSTSLGAPIGNAISAAVALGYHSSFSDALENMVQVQEIYEPRLEHKQIYDDLFASYSRLYPCLKDEFARL